MIHAYDSYACCRLWAAHHLLDCYILGCKLLRRRKNCSHEGWGHGAPGIQNHARTRRAIVQHNARVLGALFELLCAVFRRLQPSTVGLLVGVALKLL